MPKLYAQPYDICASGFYYDFAEEYETKAKANRNEYGQPVEEYEIQFIDGDGIDCELAKAIGLDQANHLAFLSVCDEWDKEEKQKAIIAYGDLGHSFDENDNPDRDWDITIYHATSFVELAEQFVDDGLFGEIPEALENYIDYEAIANDLRHDYSETEVEGERLIWQAA